MVKIQEQQATEIDKITALVEQQSRDIAILRKQAGGKSAVAAVSRDKMLQAALLLAQQGPRNVSHQAISILGALGGEKAENALLKMVADSSFSRNSTYVINALAAMHSNKLRAVVIKLLKSGNTQNVNAAINTIQNRSLQILKKSDLPLLIDVLDDMSDSNNNRYRRNNMIRVVCRMDQDTGVKYICDALETADVNQQRELVYIPIHGQINLSTKSWLKIIGIMGEPNNWNISAFQALCDGISRRGDLRLMDAALSWAEFAALNSSFRNSYINMLHRMRDPKTAKILLELQSNKQMRNNYYLKNFPGIIQNDGKYELVDAATMKKLLERRAKLIARLNARDKRRATKK